MAASVSTLVVSWKDAADRKLSVDRDALVIPIRTGTQVASCKSVSPSAILLRILSFCSLKSLRSTSEPDSNSVSPGSATLTLRIIWRMIISMCLSLISTPCMR